MRYTLALFLLCLLFLSSCREDIEELDIETTIDPPIITIGSGDVQVRGRIVNQNGVPLSDVLISNYGETTRSDDNGNYILPAAERRPDGAAFLYIAEEGYFAEYRQIYPIPASVNMVDIVLQSVLTDDIINGETGGTFETPEGVKLVIPPGGALSDGQPYTGDIRVKIVYEDPTSYADIEQSSANVPGWLNGELVELATYGMVQVRLETVRGNNIFFSPDQPASLEVPLAESISEVNDSIFFWQLQEETWSLLGPVINNDGFLSADIFGSGFFNYDIPFPRATICGTLVDQTGMLLQNQSFAILIDNGAFVFMARTDAKGQFCIQVPRDQILNIRLPDPCAPEETLYEASIGPFPEGPTQIGEISIDYTTVRKPVSVTNCADGSPFTPDQGQVWLDGFEYGYPVWTNDEGQASILIPDCDGNGTSVEVQAVANDQRRTSAMAQVSSDDLSTLELEVCGEPEGEEFFQLNIANIGDFDMDELSYLLRQRQFGPLSHQLWGQSIVDTDTTEMFIYFLDFAPGNYSFNPDIFRYEADSSSYYSTCVNCAVENRLIIDDVGPDQSFIEGSFILEGSQRHSVTRELIESGVIISGSFHINR